jgi:hypothetical protein
MHELKYKLCPRWLGWALVALGCALSGASALAYRAGRDALGSMLLVASAVYILVLIAAAIVRVIAGRPWRKPPGDGKQ